MKIIGNVMVETPYYWDDMDIEFAGRIQDTEDIIRYCGTNRYPDKCVTCRLPVPAHKGELYMDEIHGRWIVQHKHGACFWLKYGLMFSVAVCMSIVLLNLL